MALQILAGSLPCLESKGLGKMLERKALKIIRKRPKAWSALNIYFTRMAIGIIQSGMHSAADSRELPLLLFASIQEGARLPGAEVNVGVVGALQHVSRVDAPGHNAILADAALATVNLVLQQVIQEHLGPVLAEVVLVLDIGAKGDAATGTAKGCDLFNLFIIFTLALKNKKVLL